MKKIYSFDEILEFRRLFDRIIESSFFDEKAANQCLEIIRIIADDNDDEVAHHMEAKLRNRVLQCIDNPLAKIALKSSEIEFCRWFA